MVTVRFFGGPLNLKKYEVIFWCLPGDKKNQYTPHIPRGLKGVTMLKKCHLVP